MEKRFHRWLGGRLRFNHDCWKDFAITVFFFPNFLCLCYDSGGQHILMYIIYLVQWLETPLLPRQTLKTPSKCCSSRWRSDYLTENACIAVRIGGCFMLTVDPEWDGTRRRNPQNVLHIKPWTRKAHCFYTFPAETPVLFVISYVQFTFCYRTRQGRGAAGASWSSLR